MITTIWHMSLLSVWNMCWRQNMCHRRKQDVVVPLQVIPALGVLLLLQLCQIDEVLRHHTCLHELSRQLALPFLVLADRCSRLQHKGVNGMLHPRIGHPCRCNISHPLKSLDHRAQLRPNRPWGSNGRARPIARRARARHRSKISRYHTERQQRPPRLLINNLANIATEDFLFVDLFSVHITSHRITSFT